MKKILNRNLLVLAGIATALTFVACEKDNEEAGKKAAEEFCDCYKTKSRTTCLSELKSKYSESQYLSTAFIDAFNNAQTCGVKLEKTYSSNLVEDYSIIELQ